MIDNWSFPKTVDIFGNEYKIRNECDYRIMLDVTEALSDKNEDNNFRMHCAMYIFFENPENLPDPLTSTKSEEILIIQEAINKIIEVLNLGKTDDKQDEQRPKIMDWKKDFDCICPAINRVLGYDVRNPDKYTHWYTFIGAYGEIGDCYWSQIINIRKKRMKGKKLDDNEIEFYKEHKKDIDLQAELSNEEKEWLDSDW